MNPTPPNGGPLFIALAVAVGVGAVGFGVGTAPHERDTSPLRPVAPVLDSHKGVPMAPLAATLRATPRGGTELWAETAASLAAALPPRDQDGAPSGSLDEAWTQRSQRRAYDGAPPTVPHPVEQTGPAACLACHETGLAVGGRVAKAMPHAELAQCTQCHVAAVAPVPGAQPWTTDESVAPWQLDLAPEATGGSRAWSIAPPTIPHTVHMRDRCESCHGVTGSAPLKTTHPSRQNCTQCHAMDHALERSNP